MQLHWFRFRELTSRKKRNSDIDALYRTMVIIQTEWSTKPNPVHNVITMQSYDIHVFNHL